MPTASDKFRADGPAKREMIDGGTTADDSSADEIETVRGTPRIRRKSTFSDTAALLDTVRKWGCQFDGKDGVAFLERLEDLRLSYGLTQAQLQRCLPLIFKDQALLWYRNNRDDWRSWADFEKDFRRYFVPTKTRFELEAKIARRIQGPNETVREYVTALQTLMRRRRNNHGGPPGTHLP
ncbi:activity-regulated cytoskeleton associated protein 2 [Monomorium pharaonis]|uniref:activity-regulated cytoskeleton associated protein 2 n=1 Tax=Monomorium pharaonis TaxID=307658 RepID=UPI00174717F9|nr:activity-regulated cytoskeleton associated protein 2 [Monomorium pharaonis]